MKKLLKVWVWDCKVGIYDNCVLTVRVYGDRTVARIPNVKWIGNTGGYAERCERITGPVHDRLTALAAQEIADDADYTLRAVELVHGY